MNDLLLEVLDLHTWFRMDEGLLKAVDGVSLSLRHGETLGIIGESGCGKSVTAKSILRLIYPPGYIPKGRILLRDGQAKPIDLAALAPKGREIRHIRGRRISMIFQEPMTSLSPVHTIGDQIAETLLLHVCRDRAEAWDRAVNIIERVRMPQPTRTARMYPHELSGGLRQRAMIAMALSCKPQLLIADEPTTALDVTVEAQILALIRELRDEIGMAVLYITHNLGVIAQIADSMAVMYLGRIQEQASAQSIFHNPLHPYTRSLMKSIPRPGRKIRARLDAIRGTVPVPIGLPEECGFRSRCDFARAGVCDAAIPSLVEIEPGHGVRCFLHHAEKETP